MNRQLTERLWNECPLLYRDKNETVMNSLIPFGFEHMDGWFSIVYNLSLKLEAIIAAMPEEEQKAYRAVQVKEKFGTLRFYMAGETDEMEKLISEAEDASAVTCEYCGAAGTLRTKGWCFTLCDKCDEERPWRK